MQSKNRENARSRPRITSQTRSSRPIVTNDPRFIFLTWWMQVTEYALRVMVVWWEMFEEESRCTRKESTRRIARSVSGNNNIYQSVDINRFRYKSECICSCVYFSLSLRSSRSRDYWTANCKYSERAMLYNFIMRKRDTLSYWVSLLNLPISVIRHRDPTFRHDISLPIIFSYRSGYDIKLPRALEISQDEGK